MKLFNHVQIKVKDLKISRYIVADIERLRGPMERISEFLLKAFTLN